MTRLVVFDLVLVGLALLLSRLLPGASGGQAEQTQVVVSTS
jgi:hypothetical protein